MLQLLLAFNLGLFSTLHCVGMCGGILSALMLSGKPVSGGRHSGHISLSVAYNLGRVSSYTLAGLIVGVIGSALITVLADYPLHLVLQILAAAVLIGIALNILELMPFNRFIEATGARLWQRLSPLGQRLLPLDTSTRAVLFGMIWGWLPCGMVYSALLLSLTTSDPWSGMLFMLCFGLGTLPGMVTAGYFSGQLARLKENRTLRYVTALALILIAFSLPLSAVYFTQDHGAHMHHHTDRY